MSLGDRDWEDVVKDMLGGWIGTWEERILRRAEKEWVKVVLDSASKPPPPVDEEFIIAKDGKIGWVHFVNSDGTNQGPIRLAERYETFEPILDELVEDEIDKSWEEMQDVTVKAKL